MQVTLNEKAYRHIRSLLLHGKLTPGQRLVTRVLADEIGVSLAPVREALHRLATEGLIDHIPGAGAFVRERNRQELQEIFVLREAIECGAAAEAAKYVSEDQLDELSEILSRFADTTATVKKHPRQKATPTQFARWLADDERFHDILVEASRNRLLIKVVRDYRAISAVFEAQRNDADRCTYAMCMETLRSHRDLFEALKHRNSELARSLMRDQIQRGRRSYFAQLTDPNPLNDR